MKKHHSLNYKFFIILIITFLYACKNVPDETSTVEPKSLSSLETTQKVELMSVTVSSDLASILLSIKHSHYPDLIKRREDYKFVGQVKNIELYSINDSDRLNELYKGEIHLRTEDMKEKISFNKDGFVLNTDRGNIKSIYEYNSLNIPMKQGIINNGKEFTRIFNYDDLGRITSLTDSNGDYIMEWSYERDKKLPIDIRLYNGDDLDYRDIISWNNGKVVKKEMIWYNYLSHNGIGGKTLEEYEYYKDGSYMLKYEKYNDYGRFIHEQSFFDKDDNRTSHYQINYKGDTYDESHYKYDGSGNEIEYSNKGNLKSMDIPFGGDLKDVYTTDVSPPLKLLNITTNHYDQFNNLVKSYGPELFLTYDDDFTYVPAIENVTTVYKYKYDKSGNWIERVKITDNIISSYDKRIFTYY